MTRESIDPSRRSFLLPGSRRVDSDGTPVPRRAVVGPTCLAAQRVECRLCGEGCDSGAIRYPPRLGAVPWPVIDGERCTGCGDCLTLCPPGALQLA
jgi:ferredoxin-type protein NapF